MSCECYLIHVTSERFHFSLEAIQSSRENLLKIIYFTFHTESVIVSDVCELYCININKKNLCRKMDIC